MNINIKKSIAALFSLAVIAFASPSTAKAEGAGSKSFPVASECEGSGVEISGENRQITVGLQEFKAIIEPEETIKVFRGNTPTPSKFAFTSAKYIKQNVVPILDRFKDKGLAYEIKKSKTDDFVIFLHPSRAQTQFPENCYVFVRFESGEATFSLLRGTREDALRNPESGSSLYIPPKMEAYDSLEFLEKRIAFFLPPPTDGPNEVLRGDDPRVIRGVVVRTGKPCADPCP